MRCSGFITISYVASSGRIHWIVVKGCVANEHEMGKIPDHLDNDLDNRPRLRAQHLHIATYTTRGYLLKYKFATAADLSRSSSESPMPPPGHFDEPWVS